MSDGPKCDENDCDKPGEYLCPRCAVILCGEDCDTANCPDCAGPLEPLG